MCNPSDNQERKDMTTTFDLAAVTFTVPADCPDPVRFEAIVRKIFARHFPEAIQAAECRSAYRQTMHVPLPFSANPEAASHYRQASLALSQPAQTWGTFEEAVNREFADFEDDGDRKEPAIPGWSPGWVSLG